MFVAGFTPFRDLNLAVDAKVGSVTFKRLLSGKGNVTKFLTGFTLVEMTVVLAVIAVLAAIVGPHAYRAIEKAKVARMTRDSNVVKTAAYAMYADTGIWPGSNWGDDAPPVSTDVLAPANRGEGFVYQGVDPDMPASWNGPYMDRWPLNPWGGMYWWDFNLGDQNLDGIGVEHVLWLDNSRGNAGFRMKLEQRQLVDNQIDDAVLTTGRVQVWQGNPTDGNLGYILIQGQ